MLPSSDDFLTAQTARHLSSPTQDSINVFGSGPRPRFGGEGESTLTARLPSRKRIHIPPNGKRKIIDSKCNFFGHMLVPWRVRFRTWSHDGLVTVQMMNFGKFLKSQVPCYCLSGCIYIYICCKAQMGNPRDENPDFRCLEVIPSKHVFAMPFLMKQFPSTLADTKTCSFNSDVSIFTKKHTRSSSPDLPDVCTRAPKNSVWSPAI